MKIDINKITTYEGLNIIKTVGKGLSLGTVTAAMLFSINEATCNHNTRICLLTQFLGSSHQITQIDKDKLNQDAGIHGELCDSYLVVPPAYVIDRNDLTAYRRIKGQTYYQDGYLVEEPDRVITVPIEFVDSKSIQLVKYNEDTYHDEIVLSLKYSGRK
ncbi:MAG: hypothetical protein PUD34_02120 [bacterium]|nr:hypothetical protein [bacterium]